MFEKLLESDKELFLYLNNSGAEPYDFFWIHITNIVTWIPLFILFLLLVFKTYHKKEAWIIVSFVVGALLFNLIFTEIIKELVERVRPNNDQDLKSIIRILKYPTNYSFFSGHASSSFAVTTIVVLFIKKKFKFSYLFFLWPLLFCFSRIYVGVHYPSDILMGTIVGFFIGIVFYRLYNFMRPKFRIN